jgi:hypothetical protein
MRTIRALVLFTLVLFTILPVLQVPSLSGDDWNIVANPVTDGPEAVWSSTLGGQGPSVVHYSSLDAEGWAPSFTLGVLAPGSTAPELVFDDSGGRRVVWESEAGEILLRSLPPSGREWSDEVVISESGEGGSRPRAAVHVGMTFVAYEVDGPYGRSVRASKMDSEGNVERTLLSQPNLESMLEVEIHEKDARLWIDWIESGTHIGFRVWSENGWSPLSLEPYEGAVDLKSARDRVRERVLRLE